MIAKVLRGEAGSLFSKLEAVMSRSLRTHTVLVKNGSRGQVAVEYVLLLIVGVAIWLMLVTSLVSRNPDSPGMIVKKWAEIIGFIGTDRIEP